MSASMKKSVKQVSSEKKKIGIMIALLVVAAFMWLRMFLSDGKSAPATASAQTSSPSAKEAKPSDTALPSRPVVFVALSDQSQRNLFDVRTEKFTRTTKQTPQVPQNLTPEPSEEKKRTQAASALKNLKLRSTLMSAKPQAFINDRLFGVGSQPVPGFVITRITEHCVFLKHEQFQGEFELKMYRD